MGAVWLLADVAAILAAVAGMLIARCADRAKAREVAHWHLRMAARARAHDRWKHRIVDARMRRWGPTDSAATAVGCSPVQAGVMSISDRHPAEWRGSCSTPPRTT